MTTITAYPIRDPERALSWTDGELTGTILDVADAQALDAAPLTPVGPMIPADWSDPDYAAAAMQHTLTRALGEPVVIVGHRFTATPGCCDQAHPPVAAQKFDPGQPRDADGKWSGGGGDTTVAPERLSSRIDQVAAAGHATNISTWRVAGAGNENLFKPDPTITPRERSLMPVIPGGHAGAEQFAQGLPPHVGAAFEQVDPRMLTATQSQMDGVKVGQMLDTLRANNGGGTGTLIVSQDGRILDGHHRWAANAVYAVDHPGHTMEVLRVNEPFPALLAHADAFSAAHGIAAREFGKALLAALLKAFNPDQARDPDGRFAGGGTERASVATPEAFRAGFDQAFGPGNPRDAYVTHYSLDEMRSMTPLLANDGKTGVLVHDHGDGRIEATALFNTSDVRGAGLDMLRDAIANHGVNYVECFGSVKPGPSLPELYKSVGFEVTGRFPFDESQAPPSWDYAANGRPDYFTMSLRQ